jgi:hypothetical protein
MNLERTSDGGFMARRLLLLLIAMSVSVSFGATNCAKCDCAHWPWKDECERCCSLKAFNNSSPGELRYFFNFDKSLAQPLSDLREKGPADSLEAIQRALGKNAFDKFDQGLKTLSPLQRQYLISPPDQKMTIQKAPHPGSAPSGG